MGTYGFCILGWALGILVFHGGHLGADLKGQNTKVLSFKAGTYGFCILGWALTVFVFQGGHLVF